ncbi:MAG: hypothetical protein AAFY88_32400, partial [Acidobacteriota bacterium]
MIALALPRPRPSSAGLALVLTLGLALTAGSPTAAWAQVFVSSLPGLEVAETYGFHPGDGPGAVIRPPEETQSFAVDTFPRAFEGIGWFAADVEIDPALVGRPIGVRVTQEGGATEVFVDGVRVHGFGTPSKTAAGEVADRTRDPRPIVFDGPGRHRIAVRYSAWLLEDPRWAGERPGLEVRFAELRPMAEERLRLVRLLTFHQMFLTGLFLAFCLVNAMLFLFRPVAGPNFYCGLVAASSAATVFLNFASYVQREPSAYLSYFTAFQLAFIALALASLRFVYACTVRRPPAVFRAFLVAGAGL